ncbi:MAG: endonuclease V [Blastopirellula sp. JB062]
MPDFSQIERQVRQRLPDMEGELRRRIAQIPAGQVAVYARIAASLGDRVASRWVGQWLLHSPIAKSIAAHRVVRTGGAIGLFHTGSPDDKRRLLESEGVAVRHGSVALSKYEFSDFAGPKPLDHLREWQIELAAANRLAPLTRRPKLVAGLDVSYCGGDGVVSYVLFDYGSREIVWTTLVRQAVPFPYISSYLSYRELPLHLAALSAAAQAGRLADVLIVDGSGILHPRRCGVASMLAALTGCATIGVTKKRLCGSYSSDQLAPERYCDVSVDDESGVVKLGAAILPTKKTKRPIFVSPGGHLDFADAEKIVAHFLLGKRLPLPIEEADRRSRIAASGVGIGLDASPPI